MKNVDFAAGKIKLVVADGYKFVGIRRYFTRFTAEPTPIASISNRSIKITMLGRMRIPPSNSIVKKKLSLYVIKNISHKTANNAVKQSEKMYSLLLTARTSFI